jgi:hypothetical protein
MGQETFRKRDDESEGKDIPRGTGEPGDEQVNAIGRDDNDKPIGQDHSTEGHERTDPDHGVGAIQDREDRTSDIARTND